MQFNKIVLWGWKDSINVGNTFHYINRSYYKAFKHLGYNVFWFENDAQHDFDFSNSLFLTEGQVDKNIPLRDDCYYVLHNCNSEPYRTLIEKNRCCNMQVYTNDVLKWDITKLDDCIYADYNGRCIYYPWATDLLPDEIEANKPTVVFNQESKFVHWIGTIGGEKFGNIDQITPFRIACQENGITFTNRMNISNEENIRLIKESYIAPTIVGQWQHDVGYIPCRIFKNISYGQMGVTSSPTIYESLFHKKVIHNNDTRQLFFDARDYMEKMPLNELHELMNVVKDKHTFINRINHLLNFCQKVFS